MSSLNEYVFAAFVNGILGLVLCFNAEHLLAFVFAFNKEFSKIWIYKVVAGSLVSFLLGVLNIGFSIWGFYHLLLH